MNHETYPDLPKPRDICLSAPRIRRSFGRYWIVEAMDNSCNYVICEWSKKKSYCERYLADTFKARQRGRHIWNDGRRATIKMYVRSDRTNKKRVHGWRREVVQRAAAIIRGSAVRPPRMMSLPEALAAVSAGQVIPCDVAARYRITQ